MSERPQWTRRAVLGRLAWLGFMGTVPAFRAGARTATVDPPDEASIVLEDYFENIESAAIVGREYLRLVPDEDDQSRLTDLVLAEWTGHPAPTLGGHGMKDHITTQRRLDFEFGRTVRIDGWVLSQTEARLCGLAALRA